MTAFALLEWIWLPALIVAGILVYVFFDWLDDRDRRRWEADNAEMLRSLQRHGEWLPGEHGEP